MSRGRWLAGLLVLGLFLVGAAPAAARVPGTRTPGMRSHGTRPDITVPYLTNGRDAFHAYSVAPLVSSYPIVDDLVHPGVRRVYNYVFYGAVQAFSSHSVGAAPRAR